MGELRGVFTTLPKNAKMQQGERPDVSPRGPQSNRLILLDYMVCIVVAVCICMLSPLNPFSTAVPTYDSGVFITVAKGMASGAVPYRDFFDHKGPLLYFIILVGWQIGKTLGVWLVECAFMSVSIIFGYKTLKVLMGRWPALMGVSFGFVPLVLFFEGGNVSEEYVLPFLFISLFVFANHFVKASRFRAWEAALLGVCFGASLLLRPNMFALWAVFCTFVFIKMLIHKQGIAALKFAGCFFGGACVLMLPFFVYLWCNGAINDFIFQYITFNMQYASLEFSLRTLVQNLVSTSTRNFSWLAVAGSLCLCIGASAEKKPFFLNCLLASLLTILFISYSQYNFSHYSIILIPFMISPVGLIAKLLMQSMEASPRPLTILLTGMVFFCLFLEPIFIWQRSCRDLLRIHSKTEVEQVTAIVEMNAAPPDTLLALTNVCQFYVYSSLTPASKYIYQSTVYVADEVLADYVSEIQTSPPGITVLPKTLAAQMASEEICANDAYIRFTRDFLAKSYQPIAETQNYIIYDKV